MAQFLQRVKERIDDRIEDRLEERQRRDDGDDDQNRKPHLTGLEGRMQTHLSMRNRYNSFVGPCDGNRGKWFVDGCGYFWALSVALEEARESIWILDWWLSPELYLRRPPSANEQYRIDRMLIAAAQRGVKVNIIVYKEVPQALTLCSQHTKDALEVHPNIAVFRHPDHILDGRAIRSEVKSNMKQKRLAALPRETLKALFGASGDVVLYWAHHEKLCLVDGRMAFMGGLDACFGRWDTNDHPIADAHPESIDETIFPGQDYNNARIFDFQDVKNWNANKLDRLQSSRMGWSDLSICLEGPIVDDLKLHFTQRWNFIFDVKYDVRTKERYSPLPLPNHGSEPAATRYPHRLMDAVEGGFRHGFRHDQPHQEHPPEPGQGGFNIQLVRSCSQWSHGINTEHSIANAYIQVIHDSRHFVYIENQFFITATGDQQAPVGNQIGAAIVERIIRAARNGEDYKVIVCIPAVPAFAGDLKAKSSLGTRAIMEFQYNSICRGGHSIMELIAKEGIDPKRYIRFYNLRNYDRINANSSMSNIERRAGVDYETARKQHDDLVGAGYGGHGEDTGARYGHQEAYDRYQQQAAQYSQSGTSDDSVSDTYMLGGRPLQSVAWDQGNMDEMDAFVSEELYIHSKLLIADDRIVICGSANLNDRSQLGSHDSEIAVVISDPEPLESAMAGRPWQASKFAATLRRQLFRKHLGLLPAQDYRRPDANFYPVDKCPNAYDFGSRADHAVRDPLSRDFDALWNTTAATNTQVFARAFHPVPADNVRTWNDYTNFFSRYFIIPKLDEDEEDEEEKAARRNLHPKYQYGHVVTEEFPGGAPELKSWLGRIRGTLVEMPLEFLADVDDIAKEGLALNNFTQEIYT